MKLTNTTALLLSALIAVPSAVFADSDQCFTKCQQSDGTREHKACLDACFQVALLSSEKPDHTTESVPTSEPINELASGDIIEEAELRRKQAPPASTLSPSFSITWSTSSFVSTTSSSIPPTSSSIPPTSSSIPPTSSSIPPTSSSIPPTSSSVPSPSETFTTPTATPSSATGTSTPDASSIPTSTSPSQTKKGHPKQTPPPNQASSSEGPDEESDDSGSGSGGLSTGAKAGIGVGVTVGALLVIGTAAFLWLRRRSGVGAATGLMEQTDKTELAEAGQAGQNLGGAEKTGTEPALEQAGKDPATDTQHELRE